MLDAFTPRSNAGAPPPIVAGAIHAMGGGGVTDAYAAAGGINALGRDELVTAGWPGERLVAEAAAGRLYAAIATLRRMGLRDWLQRRDDGYLLDADVPFRRG